MRTAFSSSPVPTTPATLVLATVFPGSGQVYNGHFIKAVLVFLLAPLVLPWLIGIADAFFSARRISAEFALANAAAT